MFNTYTEMAALKQLFTSKFDADNLYNCVMNTKSGCLLRFFTAKQLDKLKPSKIMKMMSEYKSDVIQAYHNTSNKILKAIVDYCIDDKIPEKVITLKPQEMEWIFAAYDCQVCDVKGLMKDRFKLSQGAKALLLQRGSQTQIMLMQSELSDKDYAKFWKDRLCLVKFMKRPTVEMLRAFYEDNPRSNDMPEVDYYPADMLVDMAEHHWIAKPIVEKNDKRFGGLLNVFTRLHLNTQWDTNYGIEKTNDDELKNYAQLVDNDIELLKGYVKDRLLGTKC